MLTDKERMCPECGYHETHFKSWRQPGEPLVTVIAFWPVEERGQLGFDNRFISRCHFRTACAHAHWDLQIISKPEEAMIPAGIPVVSLEEPFTIELRPGSTPEPDQVTLMGHFQHPESATYIVGNTHYQRPSDHFTVDHKVGLLLDDLEIAKFSPLYGDQMLAIVWYDRMISR